MNADAVVVAFRKGNLLQKQVAPPPSRLHAHPGLVRRGEHLPQQSRQLLLGYRLQQIPCRSHVVAFQGIIRRGGEEGNGHIPAHCPDLPGGFHAAEGLHHNVQQNKLEVPPVRFQVQQQTFPAAILYHFQPKVLPQLCHRAEKPAHSLPLRFPIVTQRDESHTIPPISKVSHYGSLLKNSNP